MATPQEEAWARIMDRTIAAGRELVAVEPMLQALVRQHDHLVSFGFVANPTLARRVIQDPDGVLAAQIALARAVIDFTRAFRALQQDAAAKMMEQMAAFEREKKGGDDA